MPSGAETPSPRRVSAALTNDMLECGVLGLEGVPRGASTVGDANGSQFDLRLDASPVEIFVEIDVDLSGTLSREELRNGLLREGRWREDEIEKLFDACDGNHDGLVTLQEFIHGVKSTHHSHSYHVSQHRVPRTRLGTTRSLGRCAMLRRPTFSDGSDPLGQGFH